VAAATTGSTLGNTYQTAPSTVPQELMMAINTIAANQQLLYQHIALLTQYMAAMLLQAQQPTQVCQPTFQALPIQHLAIPSPPPFAGNGGGYIQGYNQGRGGRSNSRHQNNSGNNPCGRGCTAFADHIAAQGMGFGGGQGAYQQLGGINPAPPNPVKQYDNWNVCCLCGLT
jgi:hypothetical protein